MENIEHQGGLIFPKEILGYPRGLKSQHFLFFPTFFSSNLIQRSFNLIFSKRCMICWLISVSYQNVNSFSRQYIHCSRTPDFLASFERCYGRQMDVRWNDLMCVYIERPQNHANTKCCSDDVSRM